jgi:hypothetical protein
MTFRAPPRARDLAGLTFLYTILASLFAFPRREDAGPLGVLLPLFCVVIGGLSVAIRTARLEVDAGGVRWGWGRFAWRASVDRFRCVRAWANAVAVVPRRGLAWVLVPRDWEPFDKLAGAFAAAGIDLEPQPSGARRATRIQGYGWLLDVLVWTNVAVTTSMLLL